MAVYKNDNKNAHADHSKLIILQTKIKCPLNFLLQFYMNVSIMPPF